MLTCFGTIWNYDKFSRQNTKFSKIYILSKIRIYSKFYFLKNKHIGATTNKMFQNISFENSSFWKHVFWQKDPIKENSPKCKVNPLAC
jgi:hypothetical protein